MIPDNFFFNLQPAKVKGTHRSEPQNLFTFVQTKQIHMSVQRMTIELEIHTLDGKQMPDEDTLFHQIIEQLHDFNIKDAAVVDNVHISKFNGKPTGQE